MKASLDAPHSLTATESESSFIVEKKKYYTIADMRRNCYMLDVLHWLPL